MYAETYICYSETIVLGMVQQNMHTTREDQALNRAGVKRCI